MLNLTLFLVLTFIASSLIVASCMRSSQISEIEITGRGIGADR